MPNPAFSRLSAHLCQVLTEGGHHVSITYQELTEGGRYVSTTDQVLTEVDVM